MLPETGTFASAYTKDNKNTLVLIKFIKLNLTLLPFSYVFARADYIISNTIIRMKYPLRYQLNLFIPTLGFTLVSGSHTL